ncbi:unnamed protein product [Lymnaea stagnalis]|uniref:Uncharacterized protein n=1 Tax=Lymnaea stagnalis TaxID=6523 RepID=A0AAV2IC14_LYMST
METTSGEVNRFAEELHWCITQLEVGLQRQTLDPKQIAETIKILKILKSSKSPMVKKRQAMRNALGDYRKKMKQDEAKTLSGLRHSKFQPLGNSKVFSKSKFIKQSHTKQKNGVLGINLTDLTIDNTDKSPHQLSDNTQISAVLCPEDESLDAGVMMPCSSKSHRNAVSFKFIPSDNSYCFGFDSKPTETSVHGQGVTNHASEYGGRDVTRGHDSTNLGATEAKVTQKKGINFYSYEHSSNDFSFNFETPINTS